MVEPFVTEKQLVKTENSVNTEPAGSLTLQSYLDKSLAFGKQMTEAIDESQKYWTNLWQAYQRPVAVLAWIVGGAIAIKVVIALVDAINDVPLLEPILALVGLGYTGWFAYRYLIAFVSRQQLAAKIQELRDYIFGE